MPEPMIVVENLSKRYRIGKRALGQVTLRDAIVSTARRAAGRGGADDSTFFALEDVNFKVDAGEVVGIIGRNGAGKSTMLKIMSRITWPTTGRVSLYGRVGSLLEVGTGFNPELTGRDNVFLNGTILGMTRHEVRRKFDDIVAFSGIERFIDTPVKHYSSGMYMRLAFAVAAHLDPEILFVDEVLAVGDVEFQRRCLDKLQDVGRQGRTVLFVSHNMHAVTRLCERAILLDAGRIVLDGKTHEVAARYLRSNTGRSGHRTWPEIETAPGNRVVRLRGVRVRDEEGETLDAVDITRRVGVEMEFDVLEGGQVLVPRLEFINHDGACIFWLFEVDSEWHRRPRPEGRYVATAWIPAHTFTEGSVSVGASIYSFLPTAQHFNEPDAINFATIDRIEGITPRGDYGGYIPGFLRPLFPWTTEVR